MKEVYGDMFAYYKRPGYVICLTTNGFLKKDGTGVMGRGCAREATEYDPSLPMLLGKSLKIRQNNLSSLTPEFIAFPVKHAWYDNADEKLILQSALQLKTVAELSPQVTYILPRPGCGNGNLDWQSCVKPLLEKVVLPDNVWILERWEKK